AAAVRVEQSRAGARARRSAARTGPTGSERSMIGESASPGDQQSRSAADEAAPPQPTPEPGQQPAQLPAGARLVVLAADRGARRLVRGALTANRAALARYGVRVADSIPASAADGPRTVTVVDPRTAEAELVGGTTDGSQTHL